MWKKVKDFLSQVYINALVLFGIFSLVGFLYLYGSMLAGKNEVPATSVFLSRYIGWRGIMLLNIFIFVSLLPLLKYNLCRNLPVHKSWKSKNVLIAFFIALFTEMFGFSLVAYIFSPFFYVPYLKNMLDGLGPIRLISKICGAWIVFFGILLVILGWAKIHKAQEVVTKGVYHYMRHPQYTGIFFIITGWCIFWPTLPTIIIAPFLITAYNCLSRHEEQDLICMFGDKYLNYISQTPRFFPCCIKKKTAKFFLNYKKCERGKNENSGPSEQG